MKIIKQFISSLISEFVFSITGLALGSVWGTDFYFSIGNAEGWEGFGVISGIAGLCLGGLIGILIVNKLLNIEIKNIYLYILTIALILLWLVTYSFVGSTLPLFVVYISTSTLFTLLSNLSFVRKIG